MIRSSHAALVAVAMAAFVAPATAQGDPNQTVDRPRPTEVAERVNKLLDATEHAQVELEGARLDYVRYPQDAHAVAMSFGETLSGSQDPRAKGLPLDRYVRIFEGQIQGLLDERLANVGTLEVTTPLEMKSKTIAPGKYTVGVALQAGRIAGLVLRDATNPRARPIAVKLKPRRPELEPAAGGAISFAFTAREGQAGFDVVCALRGNESVTTIPLVASAEPEAAKDEDEDVED